MRLQVVLFLRSCFSWPRQPSVLVLSYYSARSHHWQARLVP